MGIFLAGFVSLIIFGNLISPPPSTLPSQKSTQENHINTKKIFENSSSSTPLYESLSALKEEGTSSTPSELSKAESAINQKIAQVLTSLNPEGPMKYGDEELLKVEDPEVFVDKYLKTELSKITDIIAKESFPIVSFPQEKIITASDSSTLLSSLLFLKSSLEKHEPKDVDMENILTAYQNLKIDLKSRPLSESLVPFYERELSLIEQDIKNIIRIQNAKQSPFEAIIAYKKREEVLSAFMTLKNDINTFAKKNKLSFEWL